MREKTKPTQVLDVFWLLYTKWEAADGQSFVPKIDDFKLSISKNDEHLAINVQNIN